VLLSIVFYTEISQVFFNLKYTMTASKNYIRNSLDTIPETISTDDVIPAF